MSMDGLRQGAQSVRNNQGGKGARGNAFFARWKPPQMLDTLKPFLAAPPNLEAVIELAEPIVLVAGNYLDRFARDPQGLPIRRETEGYRYRSHNFPLFMQGKQGKPGYQTFREMYCSAGPEAHAPQPCVGCYQVDHGAKDSKPRDQWAFNVVHLAWYHNHPWVKDGVAQTKKGSNEVILVKSECFSYKKENEILVRAAQRRLQGVRQPRQCELCGTNPPNYSWGDHRVLQVGSKHLGNLLDLDAELGKKCRTCGTFIMRRFFNCGNEQCNQHLVDIATGMQGWTNDQIKEFGDAPLQCHFCGYHGAPFSEYICGLDQNYQPIPGAGCGAEVEPQKMSAFDCVLWVQREGKDTDSEIVIKRVDSFADFKTPDGRPLSVHLSEIVKQPFDLEEMYKPDSVDAQSNLIRVQNPYAVAAQQYQQYPQQPGQPAMMPGYQQPAYPQQPQPGYPQQPNYPQTSYPVVGGRPNYSK